MEMPNIVFHLLNMPSPKYPSVWPPSVAEDHNFGFTEIERNLFQERYSTHLTTTCFKLNPIEIVKPSHPLLKRPSTFPTALDVPQSHLS